MFAPGDLVGPYRLQRLIGTGGMGHVFAAVHERMGQEVAVKLLAREAEADPQIVARFVQEARALAKLDHPGIVRIFQCDRLDDGQVYLAMELLSGMRLRDWIANQSGQARLPAAAISITRQIADVMAEVHRHGIVHRDLKPENIFLCPDAGTDSGHRVKILDFGIAKVPPKQEGPIVDTQVLTNAPVFLGTATYVAPEQCRRPAEVDGRADVYALGVILFELCAGRPPFVAEDPIDLISMHVREIPPSLSDVAAGVPGRMAAFVASMLAKEPAERPTMARCKEVFGLSWERESERDACPLPGLAPFTEVQAELFFGRGKEIAALLGLLEEARVGPRKWVQIEGPSGVGKTSLVQAGLLPRFTQSAEKGGHLVRVAGMRPSGEPLRNLALALLSAFEGPLGEQTIESIEASLRADPKALDALARAHVPGEGSLLLVIEQMEELFTIGAAESRVLDELLSHALDAPDGPLRLLTTIRSDFLHRLDRIPHLARQLNRASRYNLQTMQDDALAEVIRGMAQRTGLRLAEGLAERMVRDAHQAASPLPLVGHALRGLWAIRSGSLLSHERYDELGGVTGALSRQATELLASLGEEGRERARRILLDLVQVGRGVPDTRRPRARQEILAAAGGDALAEEVLVRLSGGRTSAGSEDPSVLRLLVVSGDLGPELQRVELVHETLLQAVPSITGWIERERAHLERQADLEALAWAWEEAGFPAEGLPSGTLLAHYNAAHGSSRRASERATRFLESAVRLERQSRRTRRLVRAILLAAAAGIIVSAWVARRAQQDAQENLLGVVAATDDIVDNIDWQLGRILHTAKVRREMLTQTEERVMSLPDQDKPEVRRTVIQAKHRRSDFAAMHGTLAEADALLVDAGDRIRRAMASSPSDPDWTRLLSLNASKRGKVAMARGQWNEAEAFFTSSIEVLETSNAPRDADYRMTLATSYTEKAEAFLAQGKASLAVEIYDRAIELLSQSDDEGARAEVALALSGRGEASRKAGDTSKAAADLGRAIETQRALVRNQPGNAYLRWILARIHVELAALRIAERAFGVASEEHRAALTLGRALHEGEPDDKRYALLIGQSLEAAESFARLQGDLGEAEKFRAERCGLSSRFSALDPEDIRFQRLVCR